MQPRHRCQTVGFGICICWSKTIQFRERQFLIPILQLSHGHRLWSLHAYERHILEFPVSQPSPAFLHYRKDHDIPIRHYIHRQIAEGSQSRRLPSQQILGSQFSPWWSFLRLLLRCSCGTYQSPRGLVFGRCFALYRTTTWAAALSGETDCLKHWQFRTFIFNYYNIFLSLFPSHIFVFFSFRFSLSGGLGEAHQGGRPSVLLPPPLWLGFFPANNKVIFAYSSCCPLNWCKICHGGLHWINFSGGVWKRSWLVLWGI